MWYSKQMWGILSTSQIYAMYSYLYTSSPRLQETNPWEWHARLLWKRVHVFCRRETTYCMRPSTTKVHICLQTIYLLFIFWHHMGCWTAVSVLTRSLQYVQIMTVALRHLDYSFSLLRLLLLSRRCVGAVVDTNTNSEKKVHLSLCKSWGNVGTWRRRSTHS